MLEKGILQELANGKLSMMPLQPLATLMPISKERNQLMEI
jgi:hypothetical protein